MTRNSIRFYKATQLKDFCMLLPILCIIMCCVACTSDSIPEVNTDEADRTDMTFLAQIAETRTALAEDGTTVIWSAGDEVAVYDHQVAKQTFTSSTENDRTQFTGQVSKNTTDFLAVYPEALASENLLSDGKIGATLPNEQKAGINTFGNGLNISVAKGTRKLDGSTIDVTFYNVCQLLEFTIPNYASGKIDKIVFSANNAICGNITVDYNGERPMAAVSADGNKDITILPPGSNTTFPAGTYYIVTAPVSINGFALSFRCGTQEYSLNSSSTFGGTAGRIYNIGNIDLVDIPAITANHVYTNNVLQGTSVSMTAPFDGCTWSAVIKNSNNVTVRTIAQGTGTLVSPETDSNWPYLPKGDYTVEYTYTTSNGKQITKSQTFKTEAPTFSISLNALTSYSYYTGDGVTKNIAQANACENNKIYAPTITPSISEKILSNANYNNILAVTAPNGCSLKEMTNGRYIYNDYTVSDWKTYTLSASLKFDDVTANADKTVQITGLPYEAIPPRNTGEHPWTEDKGRIEWNSTYVEMDYSAAKFPEISSPQFYIPQSINVTMKAKIVRNDFTFLGGSVHGDLQIFNGGTSVYEKALKSEQTYEGSIDATMSTSSKWSIQYNYAAVGPLTYVYYFKLYYR